jgi:plastocyanin
MLSCSSTDKKPQIRSVEQKVKAVTEERSEVEIKPNQTKTTDNENIPVLLEEPKKQNVVEIKAEKPKKEIRNVSPTPVVISKPKIVKQEVKKKSVQKPIIEKPQVKKTITLNGKINLAGSKNKANISSAVVYFTPDEGNYTVAPKSDFNISTKNKRFEPNVLVIPVGSEVNFPNLDRILHNVFSVSGKSEFDLGLYSAGTVKSVKFDKPGIVYVHCNVHHSMQADILVLDTPWYTNANEDGSFSLIDVPNQPGTLHVWHPRSNLMKLSVNNNQMSAFDIDLNITRKKVPKHLNKFGKSYRPKERYQ